MEKSNPPDEAICKFSSTSHTPELVISADCRTAACVSEPNALLAWGLCALPTASFAVRVTKCSNILYIGYTLPKWPVELSHEFERSGWFVCASDSSLRGKCGPVAGTGRRIEVGTVVTVEKDSRTQSLRFRLDGADLLDADGRSYGWLKTGLSEQEFESLVGAVELLKGGEVHILEQNLE